LTSSGGNFRDGRREPTIFPWLDPASAQNGHVVIDSRLYEPNRIEILRGRKARLFGSGSLGAR